MDFKSFPKIEVSVTQDLHRLARLHRGYISSRRLPAVKRKKLSFIDMRKAED